ncbi:hypothetical protein KA996_10450 [bacterium]|nr:hypothetical protein [bacterium]
MRIWSIHPKYLDNIGLVALWRETLLAKHVLSGKTKGYTNHPQLIRFKNESAPLERLDQYLSVIFNESVIRGYNFDRSKIGKFTPAKMTVTQGQIEYETAHLLKKLKVRNKQKYEEIINIKLLEPNPLFRIIEGVVENWEKV